MKKLINILNSLMILTSATTTIVSCNRIKSLNVDQKVEKKHNVKNVEDNEENTDDTDDKEDVDQLEQIISELNKLKTITADTIADNKNTIADLITELNQSEQIKTITKDVEFKVETEKKQDAILESNNHKVKIVLDENHSTTLTVKVISIDDILSKLDDNAKTEQIEIKVKEWLKTYEIEADGQLKLGDVKLPIIEKLKEIILPYNIDFKTADFRMTNDYFQDDEEILFVNEEEQKFTININLNLTDQNKTTITATTNALYTKDNKKVKEQAVSSKVETIRNKIEHKINLQFKETAEPTFNSRFIKWN